MEYLSIIISTSVVYLFVLLALRLLGKNDIAQLSISDLVFIMLLGNAVQNAMLGPNSSLSGGIVAASTLFILNLLVKELIYRLPWFDRLVEGEAMLLIYQGELQEDHLRRTRISINELQEVVREHGIASLDGVETAILEVDGNISVIAKEANGAHAKASHKSRLPKKLTKKVE